MPGNPPLVKEKAEVIEVRNLIIGPALIEKHLGTSPIATPHELLANRPQMTPPNLEPAYEVDKQVDLRKPVHSILKA